jgi:hypothetical protein
MVKTLIEIDEDALATARLGEMADQGDFDDFLSSRTAYRR